MTQAQICTRPGPITWPAKDCFCALRALPLRAEQFVTPGPTLDPHSLRCLGRAFPASSFKDEAETTPAYPLKVTQVRYNFFSGVPSICLVVDSLPLPLC